MVDPCDLLLQHVSFMHQLKTSEDKFYKGDPDTSEIRKMYKVQHDLVLTRSENLMRQIYYKSNSSTIMCLNDYRKEELDFVRQSYLPYCNYLQTQQAIIQNNEHTPAVHEGEWWQR